MFKKKLLVLALALTPFSVYAQGLAGNWIAASSDDLALPGFMTLSESGEASLAPKGFTALSGTWESEENILRLSMPPYGTSEMEFELLGDTLVLKHINGAQERFVRDGAIEEASDFESEDLTQAHPLLPDITSAEDEAAVLPVSEPASTSILP